MKKLFIALLIFSNAACAGSPAGYYVQFQELKPYVELYKKNKAKYYGYSKADYPIIVTFVPELSKKAAMCRSFSRKNKVRIISIDRSWWNKTEEYNKQYVIHHEMGHCDLNMDHSSNIINIMYPVQTFRTILYYVQHNKEALKELFEKNQKQLY